jgi:hypothetical protein
MEEIKEYEDASEGDLVNHKGKLYRVIGVEFDVGFQTKILKVVKNNPSVRLLWVKEIWI